MQTPPSSPVKAVDLFGTPKHGTPKHGTPKHGTPKRIRNESPPAAASCLRYEMPSPPKKMKSKSNANLKSNKAGDSLELPILRTQLFFGKVLGKGSFGEVSEVRLPGSPLLVAVKIVKPGKLPAKILRAEAANLGSPGCAKGVPMAGEDGTYYAFSSIAKPLNEIGAANLESVVQKTKDAILAAPIEVVYDAKPENFGFIPCGTPTVQKDENGQPMVGPLTTEDKVKIIDLGSSSSPEDADAVYNPLLDDEAMVTEEAKITFRKFKCGMMEALLRNQFADMPQDKNQIVADICTKYGWRYAGGTKYQPEIQE